MRHTRPLTSKQLQAFYKALLDADRTAAYTDNHLAFLEMRRDAFLASLKK